jgi:WXG100 family type VII secretion target
MASYSIRTGEVEEVVQEFALATRRLATSLENLQSTVQRFCAANQGQAVEAFAAAQHAWTQGHGEMSQALLLGQQRLREIMQSYISADNSSAAIFGGP